MFLTYIWDYLDLRLIFVLC